MINQNFTSEKFAWKANRLNSDRFNNTCQDNPDKISTIQPEITISLARNAGFCLGVKRAIQTAIETAKKGGDIYMLGDIVHNEDVVKLIQTAGIKKISSLGKNGRGKTLLIRAHGESMKTIKKAEQLGYTIIDATCPMVKGIHTIVRNNEKKQRTIIIIGDKKHDEVKGIVGQLKTRALVIDTPSSVPLRKLKKIKQACIVVQSTQNIDLVQTILPILRHNLRKMFFYNTICRPTKIKQQEIRTMPLQNDIMIIIGSKKSANTKRLYEISIRLNKRSFWIQSPRDIKPSYFKNARSIGITAGASTPEATIVTIIRHIKKMGRALAGRY